MAALRSRQRALVESYLSVETLRAALYAARAAGDQYTTRRLIAELKRRRVRS
jgi:hypothetical protein